MSVAVGLREGLSGRNHFTLIRSVAEVRTTSLTVSIDPLQTFESRIRQTGPGEWSETAPARCPGCAQDLTAARAVLVGWTSDIDPPHRIWTCRTCDVVIHNLDPDGEHQPMRPVRLDHCQPHRKEHTHE